MISSDNSVMLMDFGLARSVSSQLTFEGGIAGTMDYISPEQIQGEAVDGRTDIYSFGVLLYELTTGRLPFVADTPVSLLSQHLHAPVVSPIAKNASIPASLSELIVRMMSKSAGKRPETTYQVREQLDIIQDSMSDPALVSSEPQIGSLDRIVRGRLIGRKRELSEDQSLWQDSAGGQGHTLLITGEPGIGKSRLLQELTTQVEASGSLALTGNCSAEDQIPYGSISQILDELFKLISGTDSAPPEYIIADLIEIIPSLRKKYPQITPGQPLDPKSQQGRLIASIADLLHTLN
jgi:serine/threonine protein kinase